MNRAEARALEGEPEIRLAFQDQMFLPLLSGALYWPAERTLLVADLHFEKFSAFAARGQLLPPYDTGLTLSALERDIAATGARRLIALGDSFHRDEGVKSLLPRDRDRLSALTARIDWLWLAGNHDPAAHQLGGQCAAEAAIAGIRLAHHPDFESPGLIAGHLHPAARVRVKGRSVRRPCVVTDGRLMILPAYGAGTGSLNILSEAFAGLFVRDRLEVVMLGRARAYRVGLRHLVLG